MILWFSVFELLKNGNCYLLSWKNHTPKIANDKKNLGNIWIYRITRPKTWELIQFLFLFYFSLFYFFSFGNSARSRILQVVGWSCKGSPTQLAAELLSLNRCCFHCLDAYLCCKLESHEKRVGRESGQNSEMVGN